MYCIFIYVSPLFRNPFLCCVFVSSVYYLNTLQYMELTLSVSDLMLPAFLFIMFMFVYYFENIVFFYLWQRCFKNHFTYKINRKQKYTCNNMCAPDTKHLFNVRKFVFFKCLLVQIISKLNNFQIDLAHFAQFNDHGHKFIYHCTCTPPTARILQQQ